MRLKLILPIILLTGFMSFAQSNKNATQNTDFQSYFSIKAGVNFVDSAGDQAPFDSFSDANEMAFTNPYALGIDYRFSRLLSVGLFASMNTWEVGDIIDYRPIRDWYGNIVRYYPLDEDQNYFSVDANLKLYVDEFLFFLNKGNRNWLDIYVSAGGGYFQERESGISANLGLGGNLWITNKFGVSLEGMAKFAGKEVQSSNHFQYFAGVTYRFVNSDSDTDKDGIKDSKDNCPNVPGTKENDGCPEEEKPIEVEEPIEEVKPEEVKPEEVIAPVVINGDSDNDGVTDVLDNCPDVPGSLENLGCPEPATAATDVVLPPNDVAVRLLRLSKKIRFSANKSNFTANSKVILNNIITILKDHPGAKFSLVGHTDATASVLYNQGLSVLRANKVKDYLVNNGLPPSKYTITVDGKGEEEPIASNSSIGGRLLNRRVELVVKTINN